jgi:hypothetical protein
MTEVTSATSPNGDGSTIELDDAAFLAAARARLDAARERHAAIAAQVAGAAEQVKRWEKVVRDLDPEPPASKPAKAPAKAPPSRMGPARLGRIVAVIRDLAGPDGENEFRQVDVRNAIEDPTITSGITTNAFRQLRDDQVIRFTHKEGINQFFALTRKEIAKA